jgi:hypothetical protein
MGQDPRCADYPTFKPKIGGWFPDQVECRGSDELRSTFKYSRFMCSFILGYEASYTHEWVNLGSGRLTLYPAGRKTYRRKLVSLVKS